jgi:hypothetical protein
MNWPRGLHTRSWWIANLSIGGLLVAIAVAGFFALGINNQVRNVLVSALQYDLEIEDRADDLRVAVLDMRHFHRNIVFGTPSPRRIADLEAGYEQLLVRIDRIDELMLDAENLPTSEQMRQAAERYYASFRPAIDTFGKDSKAFEVASDDGLWLLAELEDEALRIERFGERQAASALT